MPLLQVEREVRSLNDNQKQNHHKSIRVFMVYSALQDCCEVVGELDGLFLGVFDEFFMHEQRAT